MGNHIFLFINIVHLEKYKYVLFGINYFFNIHYQNLPLLIGGRILFFGTGFSFFIDILYM